MNACFTQENLKTEAGERISTWHKYFNIAVFNYNTSYHTSIGGEPSRVLLIRVRYNVLEWKKGIRSQKTLGQISQNAEEDVLN